jgi:hypothetical protein
MIPWFSERFGHKAARIQLQTGDMDSDLRNGLWNIVELLIIRSYKKGSPDRTVHSTPLIIGSNLEVFFTDLWINFLKRQYDTMPNGLQQIHGSLKTAFYAWKWFEVYDFIEHLARGGIGLTEVDPKVFAGYCNNILERELSGYRLIDAYITPILDHSEIDEIDTVLNNTANTPWSGANLHIQAALAKLSDRKNPDYRNSIKEAISGVEAACRVIGEKPKATLSNALNAIISKGNVVLHPALVEGFKSLYGYTSDEGGIRHAMSDQPNVESEDATFMLVACSAFINFLIQKANRAGIHLH